MKKYLVVHPWNGVKKGQIIERESIHSAWSANVSLIGDLSDGKAMLTPATTSATSDKERKGAVCKRLRELGIDFDGRKSVDELQLLLPAGEV